MRLSTRLKMLQDAAIGAFSALVSLAILAVVVGFAVRAFYWAAGW